MKSLLCCLLLSGALSTGSRAQTPGAPPPASPGPKESPGPVQGGWTSYAPLQAATPGDSPVPTAAPAQAAEPPPSATPPAPTEDEKALAKLEQDWGEAVQKGDVAFLDRSEAEEYVYTDPSGQLSNKRDSLEGVKSGSVKIASFKIRDVKVHVYGDTAVLTGQTQLKAANEDGNISGDYRWTDVFVRRGGRWQAVASQATAIQAGDTSGYFEAIPPPSAAAMAEGQPAPEFIRAVGPLMPCPGTEEKALVQLEYAWARACATGDTAFARRVEAEEYVFTSSHGQKRSKTQDLLYMKTNPVTFELRRIKAQVDGDTATVSGQATETEGGVSAEILWTDRFVRRDGRWQAVSGRTKLIP